MNDQTEANLIRPDVNADYEANITLSKLIGNTTAVELVKTYIEAYYTDLSNSCRPILNPLLLIGDCGTTTFARAVHHYFGNAEFRITSGQWLTERVLNLHTFFSDGNRLTTYYIADADKMDGSVQQQLHNIFNEKRLAVHDNFDGAIIRPWFENRLVILSAKRVDKFNSLLLGRFGLMVNIARLSTDEITQALEQRLKLLRWKTDSVEVLKCISESAVNDLGKAMELLSLCYRLMRADNESILTTKIVNWALHLENENVKVLQNKNCHENKT